MQNLIECEALHLRPMLEVCGMARMTQTARIPLRFTAFQSSDFVPFELLPQNERMIRIDGFLCDDPFQLVERPLSEIFAAFRDQNIYSCLMLLEWR